MMLRLSKENRGSIRQEWGGEVGILGEVKPSGKILAGFVGNEAVDGYVSLLSRFTG